MRPEDLLSVLNMDVRSHKSDGEVELRLIFLYSSWHHGVSGGRKFLLGHEGGRDVAHEGGQVYLVGPA